jgi:hypothetical protein
LDCCCDGMELSSNARTTPINRCMAADMQHKYARNSAGHGLLSTSACPLTERQHGETSSAMV